MFTIHQYVSKGIQYSRLKYLCSLMFLCLAMGTIALSQSLPSTSLQVSGTSNASLQSEGRRRVFKTPVGTWVFYRGPTGISYKHSMDEVTWGGEQGNSTDDFSVAFRTIGGISYIAIAYVDGFSIKFMRGTAVPGILYLAHPILV